jgi:biotin transporter BioY
VILFCGTLWLSANHLGSLWAALSLAAIPFLPGDVLKVAAAAGVATAVQRVRHRTR